MAKTSLMLDELIDGEAGRREMSPLAAATAGDDLPMTALAGWKSSSQRACAMLCTPVRQPLRFLAPR